MPSFQFRGLNVIMADFRVDINIKSISKSASKKI